MLSDKEKAFMNSWEAERERLSRTPARIVAGLPYALLFSMPVAIFIGVVYAFFPDWYAKISHIGTGSFIAVVVALFIATLFFAYFRMMFKWEMNEQLYRELIAREKNN